MTREQAIVIYSTGESSRPGVHTKADEPMKLFTDEELNGMRGIMKVDDDYLEVVCACTSKMHGDYVAHLKVFRDGTLRIDCKCVPGGCYQVNITPEQFVKHANAKQGPSAWASCIWVHNAKGDKIKLQNTPLLRYCKTAGEKIVRFKKHRDEFLKCTRCREDRRFKLNSLDESRAYHYAREMKESWTCTMHPSDKFVCGYRGERLAYKLVRGCPIEGTCKGCSTCKCYGCNQCRFPDCGCDECVKFYQNI